MGGFWKYEVAWEILFVKQLRQDLSHVFTLPDSPGRLPGMLDATPMMFMLASLSMIAAMKKIEQTANVIRRSLPSLPDILEPNMHLV